MYGMSHDNRAGLETGVESPGHPHHDQSIDLVVGEKPRDSRSGRLLSIPGGSKNHAEISQPALGHLERVQSPGYRIPDPSTQWTELFFESSDDGDLFARARSSILRCVVRHGNYFRGT